MTDDGRGGGGFLWGVVLGGVVGFFLGSYLATEQGRQTVSQLRQRAEELASDPEALRQRAQSALGVARDAVQDGVQAGVAAARERRQELTGAGTAGAAPEPEEHRDG